MFSFARSGAMKRIDLTAALALLLSMPVAGLAQEAKPSAAKPQAATVQPAAKQQVAAVQPAAKPAADGPRRSRANEDARVCLELATNIEIHKCAEKYR
jgi:hypothetical protein